MQSNKFGFFSPQKWEIHLGKEIFKLFLHTSCLLGIIVPGRKTKQNQTLTGQKKKKLTD